MTDSFVEVNELLATEANDLFPFSSIRTCVSCVRRELEMSVRRIDDGVSLEQVEQQDDENRKRKRSAARDLILSKDDTCTRGLDLGMDGIVMECVPF